MQIGQINLMVVDRITSMLERLLKLRKAAVAASLRRFAARRRSVRLGRLSEGPLDLFDRRCHGRAHTNAPRRLLPLRPVIRTSTSRFTQSSVASQATRR